MKKFLFVTFLISACASKSTSQPEFEETKVLERMRGAKAAPGWVDSEKEKFLETEGTTRQVSYRGTVIMSGNAKPDSCMRAASDIARSSIVKNIVDSLTTKSSVEDSGAGAETTSDQLIASFSQLRFTGVEISGVYWEKSIQSDENGNRVLKLQCWAKASIPATELKKQIDKAVGDAAKKNPEVAKEQDELRNKYFKQSAGEGE